MHIARPSKLVALAMLAAFALTACGMPAGTPTSAIAPRTATVADTSAQDFTPEEAKTARELNQSGALDSASLTDVETALGRTATAFDPPAPVAAMDMGGTFNVTHVNKIGYVRELDGGKFVLALNGGTTRLSVTGKDGRQDTRIGGYVNHKVFVRGISLKDGTLMVEHVLFIPTFKFITDFFTKSRLGGTVIMTGNSQGLQGAYVVVKAGTTGYITRTQTDRSGNFSFSGLDPDTYTVTVTVGGFKPVSQQGVMLLKGKKTSLNLGMTPGA